MSFTVKSAIEYARKGELEDRIHKFLMTEGKNPEFSVGLKLQKRYWAGPLEISLDRLERICGPEESMEYRTNAEIFKNHINKMSESIKSGWSVPPLIVSYRDGKYLINDGNHRYEALKANGYTKYWIILWFHNEENYLEWKEETHYD